MGNRSMFVGLDVHEETIDVSIADEADRDRVKTDRHDMRAVERQLAAVAAGIADVTLLQTIPGVGFDHGDHAGRRDHHSLTITSR